MYLFRVVVWNLIWRFLIIDVSVSFYIHVVRARLQIQNIPYGVLLWCAGVGNTILGKRLLTEIPDQCGYRVLKTNQQ